MDISEKDLAGGLSEEEFSEFISFVKDLGEKANPSDKEKVLLEIFYLMATNPDHGYDYNMHYHRRLGFIKNHKNKVIKT